MIDPEYVMALLQETMQSFGPFYRKDMQQAIQDSGAPDDWFALLYAGGLEPEPLSLEKLLSIAPYASKERQDKRLQFLASLDLLELIGPDVYQMTDLGWENIDTIFDAAHRNLEQVQPLAPDDLDEIEGYLCRLINATIDAPEPEDKSSLASSLITDPGEETTGLVQIDQYLTDLLRFRDDAHIAAWKCHNISGQAWEALTFLWRGAVKSAEELAEKLSFRKVTVEGYQRALAELAVKGWIQETRDGFRVTEQGAAMRKKAEEETNRIYFLPWRCLSDVETTRLLEQLKALQDRVRKIAPEAN